VTIDEIEAAANRAHFAARFIPATYQAPGESVTSVNIDIDRSAKVMDDRGVVYEDRCEISIIVEEVGEGERGARVDTGRPDDAWILMDPIGNDGYEARWIAVRD
jgi:hypothetical protein